MSDTPRMTAPARAEGSSLSIALSTKFEIVFLEREDDASMEELEPAELDDKVIEDKILTDYH